MAALKAELSTGCSERPSSKAAASEEVRRTLWYVEPLSDARTTLADFINSLSAERQDAATTIENQQGQQHNAE